jgi:hypothetical protein
MSTVEGGNNIITNGLVLYLDAANTRSFVSGSTTWNDLSRTLNRGTLTNGPTFNQSNGGSIVFDGIDDYVTLSAYNFGTGDFTISYWLTKNTRNYAYVQDISNINGGAIALGPGTNSGYNSGSALNVYGGSGILGVGIALGTSFYPLNEFFELTIVRSGSTSILYLNGVSIFTDTPIGSFGGSGTAKIGSVYDGTLPYDGKISNVKYYNRALSASEILQNYNTLKTRFQ